MLASNTILKVVPSSQRRGDDNSDPSLFFVEIPSLDFIQEMDQAADLIGKENGSKVRHDMMRLTCESYKAGRHLYHLFYI